MDVTQVSPRGESIRQCEKAEVAAVLASPLFTRAPNLHRILTYICDRYFCGEADTIREYSIGVEALGRRTDFLAARDTIVRVEMSRLRKRLKEYYEGDGAAHELRLVLPPSGYVPQFVPGAQPAAAAVPGAPAAADSGARLRLRTLSLGLVALIAIALVALAVRSWHAGSAQDGASLAAEAIPLGRLHVPGEGVRILAGGRRAEFLDGFGRRWLGDRYFSGGEAFESPDEDIVGVSDATLYRTARRGDFRYDIPLEPGVYEIHLLFAETVFGKGNRTNNGEASRIFHLDINGRRTLSDFDILAEAGSAGTPADRVFKDIQPAADGKLHLRFTSVADMASLNGIEILPGTPGRLRPIRIAAGGRSFTDRAGRRWDADRFFIGGRPSARPVPLAGAPDPELYRNERWGHFSYSIPVAAGDRYTATLKFADTHSRDTKAADGTLDARVFDVYCNGVALLRGFDAFRESGGHNVPVDRTFPGLRPNAQGRLVFSFVPVKEYAAVRAIEILDEGP